MGFSAGRILLAFLPGIARRRKQGHIAFFVQNFREGLERALSGTGQMLDEEAERDGPR